MDPDAWDRVVRQNLTSTFYCARAVLPHFRARDRGVLITCSGGGSYYPVLGALLNAYACAKAAICRFTDQLTAELWESGIRINCLDPGMVWSPDTLAHIEAEEARTGQPHPNRDVNRPPSHAAELALWLASDRSAKIPGRLVSVHDSWWRDPERVARVADTVHLYRMRRVEE
jgi:3-oxoacyl-[acyl-carrier protein] reductase